MIDDLIFRVWRWRMKRWIKNLCRKDTAGWGADWPFEQCVADDNARVADYFAKRGRQW